MPKHLSRHHLLVLTLAAPLTGCVADDDDDPEVTAAALAPSDFVFHQLSRTANAVGEAREGEIYALGAGTPIINQPVYVDHDHNDPSTGFFLYPNAYGVALDASAAGPWVVAANHTIWATLTAGAPFTNLSETAIDLGVAENGVAYRLGTESILGGHPVWWLNPVSNGWRRVVGAAATRIDASDDGTLWAVNAAGEVWHVSGSPSAPIHEQIGQPWTRATDITVSSDGQVFVIGDSPNADHPVYYYNPGINDFVEITGAAGVAITASRGYSVGAASTPCGVTVLNSAKQIWTTDL